MRSLQAQRGASGRAPTSLDACARTDEVPRPGPKSAVAETKARLERQLFLVGASLPFGNEPGPVASSADHSEGGCLGVKRLEGDSTRLEVVAGLSRCSMAHLSVYRDVIEDHGDGKHALERRVPPGVISIPVDCLADLHCGRACAALQFS